MGKASSWVMMVVLGAWLPAANALAAADSDGYVAAGGAAPVAQRLVMAGFAVQEVGGALGIDLPMLQASGWLPESQPGSQLEFLDHAIQLTLHPVTLTPGKQYQAVNHPLFSHIFAYQYSPDTVRVRLLTRQFDGSRLEGAVTVARTPTGLRLVVGAPLADATPQGVSNPVAEADGPARRLPDELTTGNPAGQVAADGPLMPEDMIQVGVALLGMVVLLWLGGLVRRRLVAYWSSPRGHLSLISRVEVGEGQHVALLEADGRRLVVALEADGMRLIADLGEVVTPGDDAPQAEGVLAEAFADEMAGEQAENLADDWPVLPSDAAPLYLCPVPVPHFGFADEPRAAYPENTAPQHENRWLAAS